MKIAIIGGGFYGCYLACKISEYYPKIQISIYEKNNKLLLESAINNQYRLHQGFHYPRSIETIRQTKSGFKQFCKQFRKFIYFPKKNYYLIHKKSNVSLKEYCQIYKKIKLKFKNLSLKRISFLKDNSQYSGAIKVSEGIINLSRLYKYINKKIFSNKKIKIYYNSNVSGINKIDGTIFTKKEVGPYNLIINSSYVDLNLGLKNKFKVKYELASLIHIKNYLGADYAITIMDGNFVSVYPINKKTTTLSSVKYTPVKKFSNLNALKKFLKKKDIKNILMKNSTKIINDVKKYINLKKIKITKITLSPKVKLLTDFNSQRVSQVKKEFKLISILCGKLDAIFPIWLKVKYELKKMK